MKNKIKISILVPCYNSEKYISRFFESILLQKYTNIELIVINDGSTDNTQNIVLDYKTLLEKKGIELIYLSKSNGGLGSAINLGLKSVTGDYFCWCNSDDFYHENFTKECINYLNNNPNCNILRFNGKIVYEKNKEIIYTEKRLADYNSDLYKSNLFMNAILEKNFHFGCALVKTKAFIDTNKDMEIYESKLGQNWQILLPILYYYKTSYIDKTLFYFLEREDSITGDITSSSEKIYDSYNEFEKILVTTIKKMKLKDEEYLIELIRQKYIFKKQLLAKELKDEKVMNLLIKEINNIKTNIYEKELINLEQNFSAFHANPKVSIIIPVYNGSNYLKEAIDSAINQTYKNIEIIVVNDGSDDDGKSEMIALSYGNKIKYFSKENGGVSTALNLGIENMTGDYFSWLSHDDIYFPQKIEIQINYLKNNYLLNEKTILYSNCKVIDKNGKAISCTKFENSRYSSHSEYALLHGLIAGITLLIPYKAFEDYGLFSVEYRCIQDYLLFFDFLKTYKYVFTKDVLAASRSHEKQVTNTNPNIAKENNMLWIKMQKELPKETKIRIAGSEYRFYVDMYKYINRQLHYKEAEKFSLTEAAKTKFKKTNNNFYNMLLLNINKSLIKVKILIIKILKTIKRNIRKIKIKIKKTKIKIKRKIKRTIKKILRYI